ncbi:45934_t:CDS:2 [Gigaspora margarita]|uniref:45934_t:CDS:1 n=1 Tax=Gigaspora margarita TaxID=4874 RepID=A0ABN7VD35_GIGMA|nr:45934_t:CDS:2 [Gigaspora margarita]
MVNVTNIYINNIPTNITGVIWLNSEIQNIQLDDNSASISLNQLPGGNYSNGVEMVDCNISSTFEVISKDIIDRAKKCESIITSGANDTSSWVFGKLLVFDQAKSQFGIACRSDINYGPTRVTVQIPTFLPEDIKCLKITDQENSLKHFLGGYYHLNNFLSYFDTDYDIDTWDNYDNKLAYDGNLVAYNQSVPMAVTLEPP